MSSFKMKNQINNECTSFDRYKKEKEKEKKTLHDQVRTNNLLDLVDHLKLNITNINDKSCSRKNYCKFFSF